MLLNGLGRFGGLRLGENDGADGDGDAGDGEAGGEDAVGRDTELVALFSNWLLYLEFSFWTN